MLAVCQLDSKLSGVINTHIRDRSSLSNAVQHGSTQKAVQHRQIPSYTAMLRTTAARQQLCDGTCAQLSTAKTAQWALLFLPLLLLGRKNCRALLAIR
jgi:hypothetical protein